MDDRGQQPSEERLKPTEELSEVEGGGTTNKSLSYTRG